MEIVLDIARDMNEPQLNSASTALFRFSPSSMLILDTQGIIRAVNLACCEQLSCSSEELVGLPLAHLLHHDCPANVEETLQALQLGSHPDARLDICLRKDDNQPLWLRLSATNIADREGYRVTAVILEESKPPVIQPLAPSAGRLYHRHTHLPLPALLEDRLTQLLRYREQAPLAVLRIAVRIGSEPLEERARELLQRYVARVVNRGTPLRTSCGHCREGDIAVLLPQADLRTLINLARNLLQQLQRPLRLGRGHQVEPQACIGIAVCPEDGEEARDLLHQALEARRQVAGDFRFADPQLHRSAAATLSFETDLSMALRQGELVFHYQPIQKAASGSLTAVEALLRWQHPGRGLLYPRAFLQQLEQSPQIEAVGETLLRQACQQVQKWRQRQPSLGLTLNVFSGYFNADGFCASIAAVLTETGFPAEQLTLDISEQTLMDNPLRSAEIIREVTDLGVAVAIDDVGNHWRTQAELRHLPVRALKLDRRLTPDSNGDQDQAALAAILARYAGEHDLQLAAKGIETQDQLEGARHLPCDLLQGFLLGRPMPAGEFHAWLEASPPGGGQ